MDLYLCTEELESNRIPNSSRTSYENLHSVVKLTNDILNKYRGIQYIIK